MFNFGEIVKFEMTSFFGKLKIHVSEKKCIMSKRTSIGI